MALTFAQLVDLAQSVGCPFEGSQIAAAIALAESSGDPRAYNPQGRDDSYGLWQINMRGDLGPERRVLFELTQDEDLFDPKINARAMAILSRKCTRFRDWSTFSPLGTYKRFLPSRSATSRPISSTGGDSANTRGSADDGDSTVDRPQSFFESHKKEIIATALALTLTFALTR